MRWMFFLVAVSTAALLGAQAPRLTPMVSVPARWGPYDGALAGSGASPALSAADQNLSEET